METYRRAEATQLWWQRQNTLKIKETNAVNTFKLEHMAKMIQEDWGDGHHVQSCVPWGS